jgi:hypothetical protein
MKLITVIFLNNYNSQFLALLMNWYNKRLLPLIRQVFLTPNRINNFMDLGPMLGGSLVTTAWCVLRSRMEETPSSWGLGVVLTTPHRKK